MSAALSDRELLERAAKAYGDPHIKPAQPDFTRWIGWNETLSCGVYVRWNPLTDDGDALRLAVTLGISLDFCGAMVLASYPCGGDEFDFVDEKYGDDRATATRRAIVRAAALSSTSHGQGSASEQNGGV